MIYACRNGLLRDRLLLSNWCFTNGILMMRNTWWRRRHSCWFSRKTFVINVRLILFDRHALSNARLVMDKSLYIDRGMEKCWRYLDLCVYSVIFDLTKSIWFLWKRKSVVYSLDFQWRQFKKNNNHIHTCVILNSIDQTIHCNWSPTYSNRNSLRSPWSNNKHSS